MGEPVSTPDQAGGRLSPEHALTHGLPPLIEPPTGPAPIDLRPRATLSIGVTGHRDLGIDGAAAHALAATLARVFANLRDALARVAGDEPGVFSPASPALRTICAGTEGADALAMEAARAAGSAVSWVLPFDGEGSGSALAAAPAHMRLILPGRCDEGARAYERANEVMLANVDLVVAVWDRGRPGRRGGTGDVVQSAIASGIPVIVVAPTPATPPTLLVAPDDSELAWPIASDLALKPLADDLHDLVARIVAPPAGDDTRRALLDLIDERADHRVVRFEYQLLLKLFGVAARKPDPREPGLPASGDAHITIGDALAGIPPLGGDIAAVRRRINDLAAHYGRLYRSSTVTQILVTIAAAFFSALTLIYLPSLAGGPLVVQVSVNTLVLLDAKVRTTQRWHERWLDYRVIAERLRCLQFLQPLGLGLRGTEPATAHRGASWVDWYVRRLQRALAPPHGVIADADLKRLVAGIAEGEVSGQINYHVGAFRQLGTLDRRLARAARVALNAAIIAAGAFMLSAYVEGGADNVPWRSIAWVLLFVLPAAAAAFTAMRAGADLAVIAERSSTAAAALSELQGVIRATPMTYDRAAVAATRVAALMSEELSEWRFVFESRRARTRRDKAARRARR
jgi:hypothetical protein